MFGSTTLDIAFGLAVIYLFLSLFSSAINESISALLKSRAHCLEKGILNLLQDPRLAQAFYHHDLIESFHKLSDLPAAASKALTAPAPVAVADSAADSDAHVSAPGPAAKLATDKQQAQDTMGLFRNRGKLPSYIPGSAFAQALFQMLISHTLGGNAGDLTLPQIRDQVAGLTESSPFFNIKNALLAMVDDANNVAAFRKNIEDWFDQGMERVSSWYKRHTQLMVALIALVITLLLNANTIFMAQRLGADQTLRNTLVATAGKYAATSQPDTAAIKSDIAAIGLPLGWIDAKGNSLCPSSASDWGNALLGWLFTIIAISLGAPFWFDTLSRIMTIRSAIKPEKSDDP
ncbi:MAG TPA: hypothetical protein VGN88_13980 [Phycisphaerae bacterium]|jgi:hypothetical protein